MVGGQHIEFQWDAQANAIKATVNGRAYELATKEVEPGVYWLSWNGRSIEAAVIGSDQGYIVSMLQRRIPVELLDSRKALRRAAQTSHDGVVEVRAPMPGKVVRTLVSEGEEVDVHQGIVVMEAMKMQNEIRAPRRGTIRKLMVAEGSAINSADLIALID